MPQLSQQTRNRLCEFFLYLSKLESEIEIIRNLLCEFNNFHPFFLFKYIDGISMSSKGQINQTDLLHFLEENGFVHNAQECYQYIDLFDEESKGFLLYSQFLRIILPQANTALRQRIALSNVEKPQFDEKIQYTLAKLINYEIKGMEKSSYFLQKLQDCSDFSPTVCFEILDTQNNKKLVLNNFKELFSQSSIKIFPNELQSLFKRFDLLNDGFIDQIEFFKVMKQRTFNPNEQQTPIKDKSYVQNFRDKSKRKESSTTKKTKTQNTPIRHLNSILKQTGSSPKKEFDNQRSVSFIDASKTQRSIMNQSSILKTPTQNKKYIDQKTELRAQLQLFKVQRARNQACSTVKKVQQKKIIPKAEETSKKMQPATFQPSTFIKNILIKMMEQEREIERIKLNLHEFPDYTIPGLFRYLDKKKLGFLVAEDLTAYLTKQSLQTIIKQINPDGRILFKHFYELMVPSSVYLEEQEIRYVDSNQNFILSGKQKQLFIILLDKFYQRQSYLDKIIQEIKAHQQYDLKFLFMIVDEDSSDNEISLKDLDAFFYRQCLQPDLEDIELLFNRLDSDKDGKISFLDFINIFTN